MSGGGEGGREGMRELGGKQSGSVVIAKTKSGKKNGGGLKRERKKEGGGDVRKRKGII